MVRMFIDLKKARKQEIIGINVKVTKLGIEGKVIDETKNMVIIETKKGIKKVIKMNNKFGLKIGNKIVNIDGKMLNMRPEDRIK